MNKKFIAVGVSALTILGIFASVAIQPQSFSPKAFAPKVYADTTPCDAGGVLTYDQAVDAYTGGTLRIERFADLGANRVTVTVINNTVCSVSVSLSSYKMFGPYSLATQSQQEYFDGTATVFVAAAGVTVLSTGLPSCAAQYDVWYGDVLPVLIDNQPYGNLLAGDQVRQDNFCVHEIVVPIVASLDANAVCVVPGTNVVFTAIVTGDGITSKTLEKDTNSDGSYGEVASWGAGPGTNNFTSNESLDYSGNYSLRLMVNGTERARRDVLVNISCAPPVTPPPVTPPPVTPPPVTPIVSSLDANAVCVVPGTNVVFTAIVTGDGIVSKTVEKDTNSDGSYGEVASWGAGPGVNNFTSNEPLNYSGNYSLRLMVNGTERARSDVLVNISCGPPVTPPPVTPPPVTPPPVTPPPVTPPPVTPPPVTPPPYVATLANLHVIKHVINDNGGTSTAAMFMISVKASSTDVTASSTDIAGSPVAGMESPGTSYVVATGTYIVSEVAVAGYISSFSGGCNISGIITVVDATAKICVVTNDDVAPPPVVIVPTVVTPPVTNPGSSGGSGGYGYIIPHSPTPVGPAFTASSIVIPNLPNAGVAPPESIDNSLDFLNYPFSTQIPVGIPSRLKIPVINIDANIEQIGLMANKSLDAPEDPANAAWFTGGPRPGAIGSSVIDGHSGWTGNISAVFDNLGKLQKGDKIYTTDKQGNITTFVVHDVRTYGENDLVSDVFNSDDGKAHLNLITCKGVWSKINQSYSDRLVVFTNKQNG